MNLINISNKLQPFLLKAFLAFQFVAVFGVYVCFHLRSVLYVPFQARRNIA